MAVLWIMLIAVGVLAWGARFYSRVIGRALGERSDRPTPAVLYNDGRDYVPVSYTHLRAHET